LKTTIINCSYSSTRISVHSRVSGAAQTNTEHKAETGKKENSERHEKDAMKVTSQKTEHQEQALPGLTGASLQ